MAIIRAELELYKSKVILEGPTNGGRMSSTKVVSGLSANLFPRAGDAERAAGSTRFRKVFAKIDDSENLHLANARAYIENFTLGTDRILFHAGTQRDTQNDLTGSEDLFGAGTLDAGILVGATTMDVAVEFGADLIFRDTMICRISDKADIDAAGNETFFTISGVPSLLADVFTITFTPAIDFAYSAGARVSGLFEPGLLKPDFDTFIVTSTAGLYDEITNPLILDNQGTVEETWTLLFTSGTAFDISGDTLGSQGSGNTTSGASPNNPDFSLPFFTIAGAGFSGTFLAGDTITFITHPAGIPLWMKKEVPIGTLSLSPNSAILVFDGESITP